MNPTDNDNAHCNGNGNASHTFPGNCAHSPSGNVENSHDTIPPAIVPAFDEHGLRRLLEGDGTVLSFLVRTCLYLPGKAYGFVMALRRKAYNAGIYASYPSGLPTVSVGNITAGGSGKTPTVALLAQQLLALGHRPAILMRGYAKTAGGESDEATLYASLVPKAILAVNPDRRAGALAAKRDGASILLMDDGFQHRRLKRDLDIVLIDATSPWGGGNTLPGGLLREPKSALKAAGAVIVTRSDQVDANRLDQILAEITRIAPGVFITSARHCPTRLYTVEKIPLRLDSLRGKDVVILSGIARPEAFSKTLEQLGAIPRAVFAKPDHHPLDNDFVLKAARAAENYDALLVTTEKDFAKPLFHHFSKETADNSNSDSKTGGSIRLELSDSVLSGQALSKRALSRLRILGVDQEIQELDRLIERIIQIAPTGKKDANDRFISQGLSS